MESLNLVHRARRLSSRVMCTTIHSYFQICCSPLQAVNGSCQRPWNSNSLWTLADWRLQLLAAPYRHLKWCKKTTIYISMCKNTTLKLLAWGNSRPEEKKKKKFYLVLLIVGGNFYGPLLRLWKSGFLQDLWRLVALIALKLSCVAWLGLTSS